MNEDDIFIRIADEIDAYDDADARISKQLTSLIIGECAAVCEGDTAKRKQYQAAYDGILEAEEWDRHEECREGDHLCKECLGSAIDRAMDYEER